MPDTIRDILGRKLDMIQDYPDPDSSELTHRLAEYTKMPRSRILVGNGAVEIIYNFCNAFVPDKQVLIHVPTFGEYEAACRLAGARITHHKSMNLAKDLTPFISKIPRNGCVFVCNPNNPTGLILSKRQISRIVLAAEKKSALVFVDECFIELVPGSDESILNMTGRYNNLVILRSLTKSFGLAGIRIGYAVSSRNIISILRNIKIPWSVNVVAQQAGLAAIRSKSHLSRSKQIIKQETSFLKSKISKIPGFKCYDTATNFILIRTRRDSTVLYDMLIRHGIIVRDCKNFTGLDGNHIRVAIKTHRDNIRLVKALEAVA